MAERRVKAKKKTDNKVAAEARDQFGKGAARKLRAAGKVPAVIYGHGTDPQHVSLPGHEIALIIRRANAIIDLDISGKSQLALVKDVQRDPVRQIIEHIDLVIVRANEKVSVDVAIRIVGEPAPGLSVDLDAKVLLIETLAASIPEHLEVSVEGLEAGTRILAKDVTLPHGSVLLTDQETLVVAISIPTEQDLGEVAEVVPEDEAVVSEGAEESE